MKTSGGMKLGLALLSAVVGAMLIVSQSSAVTGDLSIGSGTAEPGDEVTVEVVADVPSPGLGAWTVDVNVQSPEDVSIVDCSAPSHSVCNPNYTAASLPTARFAGAVARGVVGEVSLGTVTLRCADHEGSSVLGLDTVGFADSTVGGPVEIAVTFSPGLVTCEEDAATSTPADDDDGTPGAAATPTTSVGGLPRSGSNGTSDGSDTLAVVIALLSAVAVATLAGYQLARHRGRRL